MSIIVVQNCSQWLEYLRFVFILKRGHGIRTFCLLSRHNIKQAGSMPAEICHEFSADREEQKDERASRWNCHSNDLHSSQLGYDIKGSIWYGLQLVVRQVSEITEYRCAWEQYH